jgi:hypothetical protein
MVMNKMKKIKIIIALTVFAVLTLAIVGLTSAQNATNQPNTATDPNSVPNRGFWGWIDSCLGFRTNQPYGSQYVAPQRPADGSVPTPSQGGYGYGYAYGPCWAR